MRWPPARPTGAPSRCGAHGETVPKGECCTSVLHGACSLMRSTNCRSLLKLLGLLVVMAPVPGGGGSAAPQASADAPGPITPDAGASVDAGCGLSFDEAVEAYA